MNLSRNHGWKWRDLTRLFISSTGFSIIIRSLELYLSLSWKMGLRHVMHWINMGETRSWNVCWVLGRCFESATRDLCRTWYFSGRQTWEVSKELTAAFSGVLQIYADCSLLSSSAIYRTVTLMCKILAEVLIYIGFTFHRWNFSSQ